MNMAKLRQILELRRATKAPPLIPPRSKRLPESEVKKGPREIIDVNLQIRNFRPGAKSTSSQVVLIFSESEDAQQGTWKVTTASDVVNKAEHFDLPSVFAVEFQFERCQYIKLEICDWSEFSTKILGYTVFAVSELVTQRDGGLQRAVVDDESGVTVATVNISCVLQPKPHSILLQFYAKNLTTRRNIMPNAAQVFFEVQKVEENQEEVVLYRSECCKYATKTLFRTFSLQSSDILDWFVVGVGNEERRTTDCSPIQVTCFYRDSKNPKVEIGQFSTNFLRLKKGPSTENLYTIVHESSKGHRKSCGEFELMKFNEMALPSFLEFISAGTAVNVAFAVDLTQSEGEVDMTNVQKYVDDVELAIRAVGEPLHDFNVANLYAAFGFGAKVPPHYRESQEFCLAIYPFLLPFTCLLQNLETDPHCRGINGVLDAFRTAFANSQPMDTAHLSHVIYYCSKLAQNAMNRNKSAVYYILVVITRGCFDDIKETVQALIFASRAPISVVFVGVGELDLVELQRLGTAGTRLNYHGRKPDRDCGQFVSIPKCREDEPNATELRGLIAERALAQIPWQMTMWMTKNGIKPPQSEQVLQVLPHNMYSSLEYSWAPAAPSSSSATSGSTPGDMIAEEQLSSPSNSDNHDQSPAAVQYSPHSMLVAAEVASYSEQGYEASSEAPYPISSPSGRSSAASGAMEGSGMKRHQSPRLQYQQPIVYEAHQQDAEEWSMHSLSSFDSNQSPTTRNPRLRHIRSESVQTPPSYLQYAHSSHRNVQRFDSRS
ncbi:Copine family protein 5 [Aphelenchoides fujianensis]|nr:Copine family protein 5 [Aphelenchoides fujianensis]